MEIKLVKNEVGDQKYLEIKDEMLRKFMSGEKIYVGSIKGWISNVTWPPDDKLIKIEIKIDK